MTVRTKRRSRHKASTSSLVWPEPEDPAKALAKDKTATNRLVARYVGALGDELRAAVSPLGPYYSDDEYEDGDAMDWLGLDWLAIRWLVMRLGLPQDKLCALLQKAQQKAKARAVKHRGQPGRRRENPKEIYEMQAAITAAGFFGGPVPKKSELIEPFARRLLEAKGKTITQKMLRSESARLRAQLEQALGSRSKRDAGAARKTKNAARPSC
jgi:hypothetical protein